MRRNIFVLDNVNSMLLAVCMGGPARDFAAQVGKCKAGARRVACTRARGDRDRV
jgi:hypothetical protein